MRQTLWTPTYNRAKFLPRLYESVKNQTFKDFEWLIIDDGSTDNTKDVVQSFIDEGVIKIRYVYKENGGKHTAMQKAYEIATTPYISSIDSDEELQPQALELWEKAWAEIEASKREDIARVCLFCQAEDGGYVGHGDFCLKSDVPYVEGTWHEFVLRQGNHREMMGSLCLKKFKECFDFSKYTWHKDTNRYLGEIILWSSLGRKYKTRVVNGFGNIYHEDAGDSLLRAKVDTRKLLNEMVNAFYFLDENMAYFWWNPKYYVSFIAQFIILGRQSKTTFTEQWNHITNRSFKLLFFMLYWPLTLLNKMGVVRK